MELPESQVFTMIHLRFRQRLTHVTITEAAVLLLAEDVPIDPVLSSFVLMLNCIWRQVPV